MTPDVNVVISHSEYTVLVVDDVVSNVLLLKVLLTNEKFKVITAGNGKEALSQAVNARPDLILLDVMMPEMNGFEVAERLKADPETQHIPIIFLTALNLSLIHIFHPHSGIYCQTCLHCASGVCCPHSSNQRW